MVRRLSALFAASVAAFGLAIVLPTAPAGASSPVPLVLTQNQAFAVLGYWCGGITEQSYATGFDPTTGYPMGDLFLKTVCSGSGRGGISIPHTAWASAEWDFTGVVVSYSGSITAPSVDPAFSATDANGNEIYNQSDSAYLLLAPTFVPTPRVTGISVSAGPASGGTTVTITGTGFTNATSVSIGGAPTSYSVTNDNSITAVTAAEAAGTVDVTVTSAGGTSTTSAADQFTFVPLPVLTSISPNEGPVSGGNYVTLTGSGLTAVTSVTFAEQATAFTVENDSTISVYVPGSDSGPDSAGVFVSSLGGTSATLQYNYVSPGTVTAVLPGYGRPTGGAKVAILGTGFTGTSAVEFGTTPAVSFAVVTDAEIIAYAPPGTGLVDVTVTGPFGTTPTTPADRFNYGPVITKMTPVKGSVVGGTRVTLAGHNLQGTSAVDFGDQPALSFTVNSLGTAIVAYTPPVIAGGPNPVTVTVNTPGGSGSPVLPFTYGAPIATRILPISGPVAGGTTVVIYGNNLLGATAVDFGSTPATVESITNTTVTVLSPAGAATGKVPVTVSNPVGTSIVRAGDWFTYN